MNLHIGQITVPIQLERRNRKSIGITVTDDKQLRVRAPENIQEQDVLEAVQTKKPWILKTLRKIDQEQQEPSRKEYLSGQKLRYKGRRYKLLVQQSHEDKLQFQNSQFTLTHTEPKQKAKTVQNWFRTKAQQHLKERGMYYIQKIGPAPTYVIIQEIQAWGKYKDNTITLHPRLIHAPQGIIDYVIVHECIHAKHNHHGEQFWNYVQTHIPDYKERKEWLRKNGNLLLP